MTRNPDFVVDISDYFDKKVESIKAYGSQVTGIPAEQLESKTFLRSGAFWEVLNTRAKFVGTMIHVRYGEPFYSDVPVRVNDVYNVFLKNKAYK
jgi:hypothetical protein